MAQKTLISMERDRLRDQQPDIVSAPVPDTPHSLDSGSSPPLISNGYTLPTYREPFRLNRDQPLPHVSGQTKFAVCQSSIAALASSTIDGFPIDACGSDDGQVRLVNSENQRMFTSPVSSHQSFVSSLAFVQSSKLLISASGDGEIILSPLNPPTAISAVTSLHVHSSAVWSMEVLDNSLLTASMDHTCRLIDLESLKTRQTFKGFHCDSINLSRFWSQQTVLTGSADKSVCLWDIRSGHKVSSWYKLPFSAPIVDISDLGSGQFACVQMDGKISICDKNNSQVVKIFHLVDTVVSHTLAVSANQLAIACIDGTVKFLNLDNDGNSIDAIPLSNGPVLALSSRQSQHDVITASTSEGSIHVIEFHT